MVWAVESRNGEEVVGAYVLAQTFEEGSGSAGHNEGQPKGEAVERTSVSTRKGASRVRAIVKKSSI